MSLTISAGGRASSASSAIMSTYCIAWTHNGSCPFLTVMTTFPAETALKWRGNEMFNWKALMGILSVAQIKMKVFVLIVSEAFINVIYGTAFTPPAVKDSRISVSEEYFKVG